MNIRCRNCGGETPDHARYCIRCGADTDAIALPRDTMTYMAADDGESPVYTNFGGAIRLFFKNYFNFSGRSTRSEYWYAYLFILLANAGLEIAERMSGLTILKLIWDLLIFVPLMSQASEGFTIREDRYAWSPWLLHCSGQPFRVLSPEVHTAAGYSCSGCSSLSRS